MATFSYSSDSSYLNVKSVVWRIHNALNSQGKFYVSYIVQPSNQISNIEFQIARHPNLQCIESGRQNCLKAEARAKNAGSARRSRKGRIAGQRPSDNRVLYRSGRGRKDRKSDFWRVCHNRKVVYRR